MEWIVKRYPDMEISSEHLKINATSKDWDLNRCFFLKWRHSPNLPIFFWAPINNKMGDIWEDTHFSETGIRIRTTFGIQPAKYHSKVVPKLVCQVGV